MKNPNTLSCLVVTALLAGSIPAVFAAEPAKSGNSKAAAKARPVSLRAVEYPELENHVGAKLVIHTTNSTTRSGVLKRYTGVNITIQLGAENGAIELVVPRNTIREALLEIAPADPLFPNEKSPYEGKSGAQKN
jgi:hypothetical protein